MAIPPRLNIRAAGSRSPRPERLRNRFSRALLDELIDGANLATSANPGSRTCPQDAAINRFKISVYNTVRNLFANGHQNRLKTLVDSLPGQPRSVDFDRNPFHWALFAIIKSEEVDEPIGWDMNNIGWQLLHAYNHHIEPELLIGFLYQTAASSPSKQRKIKKVGESFREPWLAEYQEKIAPSLPMRLR